MPISSSPVTSLIFLSPRPPISNGIVGLFLSQQFEMELYDSLNQQFVMELYDSFKPIISNGIVWLLQANNLKLNCEIGLSQVFT